MRTIRLLTIGNSFAENALMFLEALAEASGAVRFQIGRANLGGCSLEKHWNLAQYTARHPEYKTYRLCTAADGSAVEGSLQEALKFADWDYVTLQQVSNTSWRAQSFQPYLGLLHEFVRKNTPGAEILLHQTWAYRTDAPFLPESGLSQELMCKRIKAAYAAYAEEYGCAVLPSGEAVQRLRAVPGRTFTWPDPDFDYQGTAAPALPDQTHSLIVGWQWSINRTITGIPQLYLDPKHLNQQGCYLVGCVWFERLTGLDVRAIDFKPPALDADSARIMRGIAHEVCSD